MIGIALRLGTSATWTSRVRVLNECLQCRLDGSLDLWDKIWDKKHIARIKLEKLDPVIKCLCARTGICCIKGS